MSRTLTAQDRSSLIRLASDLPKGSPERKAILAGLKKASYMTSDLEEAARRGDPKNFAKLLFEEHDEDSSFVLDSMLGELQEVLGGENPQSFRRAVDTELGKLNSGEVDSLIDSSPWRKELFALSDVMGESAVPDKVRKIKYQPKMSRGAVVGVWVEGIGADDWEYAGSRSLLNASDALKNRTTLDQILACLQALGAKPVSKGPARRTPSMFSQYD